MFQAPMESRCSWSGNTTNPTELSANSQVPRVWGEDHLLPSMPDGRGHNRGRLAPGGIIYRVDPDGSITRIISDAGKPNGVCISPDQKTLYVVSNANGATGFERLGTADDAKGPVAIAAPLRKGHMALMAYDLDKDGEATYRETLVDYYPEDGPDGLIVDSAGNLVVAERSEKRPGIAIYSPAGKELGFIETPTPTNVGFGRGKNASLLYITAGADLYRIRLNTTGYQLPAAKQKRK